MKNPASSAKKPGFSQVLNLMNKHINSPYLSTEDGT